MTRSAGPPPFKPAGFRAEPIDPREYNAQQEYDRGHRDGWAKCASHFSEEIDRQWRIGWEQGITELACSISKMDRELILAEMDRVDSPAQKYFLDSLERMRAVSEG